MDIGCWVFGYYKGVYDIEDNMVGSVTIDP